ncbi:translation initiation factor IF-2 [uncultured Alphaproteobacteria bacterium]|uniref:Translation initiation factor IF-2 n=1 Tax=uncultured Alphaproteobacteria bacterium TaxID=91750 RepID=A0A212K9W2_9PROT|nr:translation initiation factor IF-2 [uncultured Alphaproteobacteria bacterium]
MADDTTDNDRKAPLTLRTGTLELKKTVEKGRVRQSFSHGRSKEVKVEVRRKRTIATGGSSASDHGFDNGVLTNSEKAQRLRVLQEARRAEEEARRRAEEEAIRAAEEAAKKAAEEEAAKQAAEEEAAKQAAAEAAKQAAEEEAAKQAAAAAPAAPAEPPPPAKTDAEGRPAEVRKPKREGEAPAKGEEEDEERARRKVTARPGAPAAPKVAVPKKTEPRRRSGKLTITAALSDEDREERGRSLSAVRRAREKERLKQLSMAKNQEKVVREVVIPETISVQDLANRMAERGANVIKTLMKLGMMVNINQVIDADTAQLVVEEFGHVAKRVAESDVEEGLRGAADAEALLLPRPPVVTVMGHVDHGKTSLLDALRSTDVAAGEAGGITQHIGAYQVESASGNRITFIDTPGHEAFTAMRARGAQVTDIVVLVVAADDGIMPQTVEAIRHARAAQVPIIVAINKIDKPGANPDRVRTDLLQHEVVVESLGGDVQTVEVSAKKKLNLGQLEEAILMQAEILDLKANPNREAEGVVVEARMETGRGSVATVLVQRGTLHVGDIFVAGKEWGRVRAMTDHRGQKIEAATPGVPVEVVGFQGTPGAGDDFIVTNNEQKAREVADYRQRKEREASQVKTARSSMEEMFARIQAGEVKEFPVVVKADVQGSVEALIGTLEKIGNDDVRVRVLHAAVGAINESDVTLAKASHALTIGFNVRANAQARDLARRDNAEIRYYSIIYDVAEDMKRALSGMLAPELKENFIGYAEIRQVFSITKVGKVAGCMVTEGVVRRGAKVRLLRDNVVIHEGALGQLKRFKDDAKEVREGYECGMSFENYNDLQVGDVIECYEIEEVAVSL